MKRTVFFLLLLLSVASSHGVVITQWTFESPNIPPDLSDSAASPPATANVGTGTASGLHANAATDWTTPVGNGSANSFSANTWGIGDYWQFQLSTLGFIDLLVSFDQTSSATGPRDFKLQYSLTGLSFTDFQNYAVLQNGLAPNQEWNATTGVPAYALTFNLSSIAAIENVPVVYFRLSDLSTVSASGATVAAGGTSRVDNFTVNGTPAVVVGVPETGATILLFGLALVGMVGVRTSLARQRCAEDGR